MQRPRRVFGYIRVSGDEQGRTGTSLAAQRDEIERYCRAHSWPDPVVFSEVESGGEERLDRRVELRRLVTEAERGDVVLVAKTDRWSRSLVHGVASVRDLVKRGIGWISIGEGIDASTSQGDSTLGIMAWAADNERKRIKERTVGRRLQLRDLGVWTEGLYPLGYRRDPTTRRLVIVETEAAVVRNVFARCIAGESIATIAREMNAARVSRNGRPRTWDKKAVHSILLARWYLGEMRHSDGTWHPAHEAIVDIDTFERAQSAMKGRRLGGRTASSESRTNRWLLRGIAHCGSCAARMGAAYSRATAPFGYYACAGRLRGGDCDEPYANVEKVDTRVAALVARRLEELRDLLGSAALGSGNPDTARLDGLERNLDGHRQRRARLLSLAVDGVMTKDDLTSRLVKLDAEIRTVEAAIREETRRVRPVSAELRASVLKDVVTLRRAWDRVAVPKRREVLSMLAERVTLHEGEPSISWTSVESLCAATVGRNLFPATAAMLRKTRGAA